MKQASYAIILSSDPVIKVVRVQIYGNSPSGVLDTGAVPNLISAELSDLLDLVPSLPKRLLPLQTDQNKSASGAFEMAR